MYILDKINLMLDEEGETTGTTTGDVAKIPQGTKKMFKKKKRRMVKIVKKMNLVNYNQTSM
ncbi:MAG: hypothetical protein KQ78_02143 [Candidatus Izimaplasma bacterium HR2]|nr:MAG: hypothetical protein KQ78_02143 [Candidatus Izimaplasma bacterium HR2]